MNATVVVRANEQSDPALILFGRDNAGKPRASWFDALSADLARKAAKLMKMRVLQVETEEQKAVARQLQPGRVFEDGRAFTPFARREVFSKLVEFEGAHASTDSTANGGAENARNGQDASAQSAGGASIGSATNAPKSPEDWDEIGVGSVVLAEDKPHGWWEAIVIGERGDSVTLKWLMDLPTVRRRTELALLPAKQRSSIRSGSTAPKSPEDWDEIGVGSVVLAEDKPHGWWEGIVTEENGETVTVEWVEESPTFVRRRTELALPPAQQH